MKQKNIKVVIISISIAFLVGGLVMALIDYNPVDAYKNLIIGAVKGPLNFGTTLQKFVPIMLTGLSFIICSKVSVFNIGMEGQLYLGAISAAYIGYIIHGIWGPAHTVLCFAAAIIVGMMWGAIPGLLKVYLNVNEICVTLFMNYIAKLLASYLATGPMSASSGVTKTPDVESDALLTKFLFPSKANTGLFIAIAIIIIVFIIFHYTRIGYKMNSVGYNEKFSECIGINPRKYIVVGMMLSGAVGAMAGAIEVLGVYGYYLDGFSSDISFDGIMAAMIAKNNIALLPIWAFFIAVLQSGALGMQRNTGVPSSIISLVISIFILFVSMEKMTGFFKVNTFFRKLRERRTNI